MSAAAVWTTMVVIGLGTFLLRLSFIGLLGHGRLPEGLRRSLRYVPPAVLSALVLPALLGLGHGGGDPEPVRWLAGAVAALVAWWRGNVIWTMVAGMGVLWLGTAITGA